MSEWTFYAMDWEFFAYDDGDLTFDIFTADPNLTVFDSTLLLDRISRNKIYSVQNY
jgi:hypothetical protein